MDENCDFDELAGEEFDFYGVDGTYFKLDDQVYAFVDNDDSYSLVEVTRPFSGLPIARVTVEQIAQGCYELVDLHDSHVWLSFGVVGEGDDFTSTFFDSTPRNEVPLD